MVQVDLVVPQNVFSDVVWDKLVKDRPAPDFKRVIMSLHDVLTGDFFSGYIKSGMRRKDTCPNILLTSPTGNALMLSEGRRGIDNVFYVQSGQLTMLLDKEHYERAGLVGKPHGAKGKRGLKPRWGI
jgi:Ribonuclease P 40kDa (Rpp40) subunit.